MKTQKEFFNEMHRMGCIASIIALIIMLGIPTIIGITYNVMPDPKTVMMASAGLLAVFAPLTLSEVISYSPIMGSSISLVLITGNVINLKLPAALNALKLSEVEQGTEEGDIVIGIAIATSSIVTTIMLAVGVLVMSQLKPVLESEVMQTATQYILPALFGSLAIGVLGRNVGGGIRIDGRLKAAIIPTLLIAAGYFVSPFVVKNLSGILILIAIPIIYFSSKYLYKKGHIVVHLPSDNAEVLGKEIAE